MSNDPIKPLATPAISPDTKEGLGDREPSMALSVLDDIAQKEGWGDARMRFNGNDIKLITDAMMAYAGERIAACQSAPAIDSEPAVHWMVAQDVPETAGLREALKWAYSQFHLIALSSGHHEAWKLAKEGKARIEEQALSIPRVETVGEAVDCDKCGTTGAAPEGTQ